MDYFKSRTFRTISLGILLSFMLSACGIKGPLYIPEKRYPQQTTSFLKAPFAHTQQHQLA